MRSAYESRARSMSSPLLARWKRSQRKPTFCAPVSCTRSRTRMTSSAVRSGYGFGPLTGSSSTLAPIRLATVAAAASCSTPSSSCWSGEDSGTRFPYSALKARTPSRSPMPTVTSRLSRNSAVRAGTDSTPQSGPARSPAKKFSPMSDTPALCTASTNPSSLGRLAPADLGHGHQNSIASKPAAAAAPARSSSGTSVNNMEQLAA